MRMLKADWLPCGSPMRREGGRRLLPHWRETPESAGARSDWRSLAGPRAPSAIGDPLLRAADLGGSNAALAIELCKVHPGEAGSRFGIGETLALGNLRGVRFFLIEDRCNVVDRARRRRGRLRLRDCRRQRSWRRECRYNPQQECRPYSRWCAPPNTLHGRPCLLAARAQAVRSVPSAILYRCWLASTSRAKRRPIVREINRSAPEL